MRRLRESSEWKLVAALAKANRTLAGAWWLVLAAYDSP
jgi:hypothetical protein